MPPPDRVFRPDEILRALAAHGVEFVVVGGAAVQAHGYIRLTQDLDVIVRPDLVNVTRLSEAFADLEAELRTKGTIRLGDPNQLRRAPHIPVMTRAGALDVVHVEHIAGAPRSYDALRDGALVVRVGGNDVAFAGLSDLVRMKRAAGRRQDLMDIEALTHEPEST
jgi:predicted nucleotidyltransferase